MSHCYSTFKLSFLLAIMPFFSFGQFQKVYTNAPYDQEGQDVVAMSDGGFLIAGYTTNNTINDMDVYVFKTDAAGNQQWTKTFGGNKPDFVNRILKTADGNYFLIGYSQSYGGGDYDIFLIKIDGSGNEMWKKTYGSNGNELGMDIIETADNNYLIVGSAKNANTPDFNANLRKIDPAGNEIWNKVYGGSAHDYGNSVKLCSDGGFIVLGQTFSSGAGSGDAYLVRTDANGNETWNKTFGETLGDEGVYITANNDGTFTFLSRDSCTAGRDIDIKVIKTDANGNQLWTKQYGASEKDTPKMIQPTSDGGYIVAGISRSFGWINPDMWILKLNSSGDTTWTRHYGGVNNEHCYTVREMPDGSYIAVGKTASYGPDLDPIFLKLNGKGTLEVGIHENAALSALLNIYPNPSKGMINLNLNGGALAKVSVTNAIGAEILSTCTDDYGNLSFNIEQSGFYIITCQNGNAIITRKIVVSH